MDQKILWAVNKMPKTDDKNLPIMGLEEIKKARTFHESFPQYSETPLTKLPHMASYLGVKEVYVKDESYRFGLNAFKVLGGSFAMARYIAKETGKDVSELPYSVLTSEQLRKEFGQATFFTYMIPCFHEIARLIMHKLSFLYVYFLYIIHFYASSALIPKYRNTIIPSTIR